jgi:hypothetical protein
LSSPPALPQRTLAEGLCTDTAPLTIPILQPGQAVVIQIPWYPPNPADVASFGPHQSHFCLLARIETSTLFPFGMDIPETPDVNANTKNNNKIVWKNVTVDVMPGPIREPPQGAGCTVGVNRGQHPAMVRIQGIQQGARFRAAHLADDDPVEAMAQGGFHQIFERDCALMRVELGFGGDHVGFADIEFRRVFDNQDASRPLPDVRIQLRHLPFHDAVPLLLLRSTAVKDIMKVAPSAVCMIGIANSLDKGENG